MHSVLVDASRLLAANPPRRSYGVAVADLTGSGDYRWIVTGFGDPNRVLRWDGQALVDEPAGELADPSRAAIGVAGGDVDGDGAEELYVLNTDTFAGPKRLADRFFDATAEPGDGPGGRTWIDLFELAVNAASLNLTAGRSVAVLDRRRTGRYGVVVANYGGPMRLYEVGHLAAITDVAAEAGMARRAGGRSLACGPLASEHVDVFAGNENGPNFLFAARGDGTYAEVAQLAGVDDPYEHARGVALVDLDGDGLLDLALGNWEGPGRLFVRDEIGRFCDIADGGWARPGRVRSVVAADFDNDGHEELFVNMLGEPNRLFTWQDGWQATDPGDALLPDGFGTGAAVGDLDGDGRLELLVAHGEAGAQPLGLFRGPANGNHWLRVAPLTPAGAPARGAVVRLHARDRTQIRVVDSGSGYLCQMEPVAHFGLGASRDPVTVQVRWPTGATARIPGVEPDQTLRLAHPEG